MFQPIMLFHASYMASKASNLQTHHLKDLKSLLRFDKKQIPTLRFNFPSEYSEGRPFQLEKYPMPPWTLHPRAARVAASSPFWIHIPHDPLQLLKTPSNLSQKHGGISSPIQLGRHCYLLTTSPRIDILSPQRISISGLKGLHEFAHVHLRAYLGIQQNRPSFHQGAFQHQCHFRHQMATRLLQYLIQADQGQLHDRSSPSPHNSRRHLPPPSLQSHTSG